jgi:hypothetical protein
MADEACDPQDGAYGRVSGQLHLASSSLSGGFQLILMRIIIA